MSAMVTGDTTLDGKGCVRFFTNKRSMGVRVPSPCLPPTDGDAGSVPPPVPAPEAPRGLFTGGPGERPRAVARGVPLVRLGVPVAPLPPAPAATPLARPGTPGMGGGTSNTRTCTGTTHREDS
jgi:hypothetical protein